MLIRLHSLSKSQEAMMKFTATFLTIAILASDFGHGFEREAHRIRGHMAALFTPFHPDGTLDLGKVQ